MAERDGRSHSPMPASKENPKAEASPVFCFLAADILEKKGFGTAVLCTSATALLLFCSLARA